MAIKPGGRLGVYEVRELIGAGGMGEVYRGHDSRLNRDVALKILPALFAADAERIARFKREAQVLASLNHPNIGSIFGFEEADDAQALVLELVDGPTLADRIAQGALPLDEALATARQIAEALEAAHAQGVIHRDLKPANIKVRPDGAVKVLDFGLAKMFGLADAAASQTGLSPASLLTITSPAMTLHGMVLGTAAYMSPEQARGRPVDKRSDIWSFGGVLFEMLAGKRAFDGDDVSDTLANVLKREPDWAALPADTPAAVRRVLQRCLEKDSRRRIHDVADARLELEDEHPDAAAPALARSQRFPRERGYWALLAAVLTGALLYAWLREPAPSPVVRFQVQAPQNGFLGSGDGVGRAEGTSGAAVSPDGTQLAYVATDASGRSQIWLRHLGSFTSRALPGTEEGLLPFWAPDSRSLGFFAADKLKTLNLTDGSAQTIGDVATPPRGGSWGAGGVIVFSSGTPAQLARVSARGGAPEPIQGIKTVGVPRWPWFLPDGRHFVFVGRSDTGDGPRPMLYVGSTDPAFSARPVTPSDSNAAYVPPGVLLFLRGDALLQQPFDVQRLEVTGEPSPTGVQIVSSGGIVRVDFAVSQTGVLAFRSTTNQSNQFAWFDRTGKLLETVGAQGDYRTPALSPDGTQLVYTDVNQGDLWIYHLTRKTSSRFSSGTGTETAPVWFPDGTKIAYRKDQGGMFEREVGGTATEQVLFNGSVNGPMQVSPDGAWLVYFAVTSDPTQDIFILPTTGERTPKAIIQSPFPEVEPQISPDMRWIAYASRETGGNEIYVQPFPPNGRRWQVSSTGGRQPQWRADGRELFFVADDRKFYAVDIAANPETFDFGIPRFLFDMRANVFNSRNSYIPSRDGQRFLINMLLDADDAPINVVLNWDAASK